MPGTGQLAVGDRRAVARESGDHEGDEAERPESIHGGVPRANRNRPTAAATTAVPMKTRAKVSARRPSRSIAAPVSFHGLPCPAKVETSPAASEARHANTAPAPALAAAAPIRRAPVSRSLPAGLLGRSGWL